MRITATSTKTKWKTKCNKCANVCSMFVYSHVCFRLPGENHPPFPLLHRTKYSHLLEFSINNKLYISSLIFHVFPNGRSAVFLECRARTGRFGRKYTKKLRSFSRGGRSKSSSPRRGERPPMILLHTFHFYMSFAFDALEI